MLSEQPHTTSTTVVTSSADSGALHTLRAQLATCLHREKQLQNQLDVEEQRRRAVHEQNVAFARQLASLTAGFEVERRGLLEALAERSHSPMQPFSANSRFSDAKQQQQQQHEHQQQEIVETHEWTELDDAHVANDGRNQSFDARDRDRARSRNSLYSDASSIVPQRSPAKDAAVDNKLTRQIHELSRQVAQLQQQLLDSQVEASNFKLASEQSQSTLANALNDKNAAVNEKNAAVADKTELQHEFAQSEQREAKLSLEHQNELRRVTDRLHSTEERLSDLQNELASEKQTSTQLNQKLLHIKSESESEIASLQHRLSATLATERSASVLAQQHAIDSSDSRQAHLLQRIDALQAQCTSHVEQQSQWQDERSTLLQHRRELHAQLVRFTQCYEALRKRNQEKMNKASANAKATATASVLLHSGTESDTSAARPKLPRRDAAVLTALSEAVTQVASIEAHLTASMQRIQTMHHEHVHQAIELSAQPVEAGENVKAESRSDAVDMLECELSHLTQSTSACTPLLHSIRATLTRTIRVALRSALADRLQLRHALSHSRRVHTVCEASLLIEIQRLSGEWSSDREALAASRKQVRSLQQQLDAAMQRLSVLDKQLLDGTYVKRETLRAVEVESQRHASSVHELREQLHRSERQNMHLTSLLNDTQQQQQLMYTHSFAKPLQALPAMSSSQHPARTDTDTLATLQSRLEKRLVLQSQTLSATRDFVHSTRSELSVFRSDMRLFVKTVYECACRDVEAVVQKMLVHVAGVQKKSALQANENREYVNLVAQHEARADQLRREITKLQTELSQYRTMTLSTQLQQQAKQPLALMSTNNMKVNVEPRYMHTLHGNASEYMSRTQAEYATEAESQLRKTASAENGVHSRSESHARRESSTAHSRVSSRHSSASTDSRSLHLSAIATPSSDLPQKKERRVRRVDRDDDDAVTVNSEEQENEDLEQQRKHRSKRPSVEPAAEERRERRHSRRESETRPVDLPRHSRSHSHVPRPAPAEQAVEAVTSRSSKSIDNASRHSSRRVSATENATASRGHSRRHSQVEQTRNNADEEIDTEAEVDTHHLEQAQEREMQPEAQPSDAGVGGKVRRQRESDRDRDRDRHRKEAKSNSTIPAPATPRSIHLSQQFPTLHSLIKQKNEAN